MIKTAIRCFACNRPMPKSKRQADTRDAQVVWVGRDCYRKIEAAGEAGWSDSPNPNHVRLYPMRQITDDEVDAYIRRLAAQDIAAGIE